MNVARRRGSSLGSITYLGEGQTETIPSSWPSGAGQTAGAVTLLIAEDSAPCALPLGHLWGLALLQQAVDEPPPSLAARVAGALDRMHENQQRVSAAWLLLNEHGDVAARAARSEIAGTVAGAIARGGGGLLVLVASPGKSGDAAFALLDDLLGLETPTPVSVRVCFNRSRVSS